MQITRKTVRKTVRKEFAMDKAFLNSIFLSYNGELCMNCKIGALE